MIQLETKSRKTTCPNCGAKQKFKRYVGDGGEYLNSRVGRCDREVSCGYHYTPKQYFADNPDRLERKPAKKVTGQNYLRKQAEVSAPVAARNNQSFNFIPFDLFRQTLGDNGQNAFVQFLLNLFPGCADEIQTVLRQYFVGTFGDYTCFPSVDNLHRITKAKLIRFNPETGRRLKGDYDTSSLVAQLRRRGKISGDFNYKPCFFGEHLLHTEPGKAVAVVESEKSAIIGALCLPEFIWLAAGSKQSLKVERLQILTGRRIVLYPDADGFEAWQKVAQDARAQGISIKASNLIENHATPEQKASGYDLADYLIGQQQAINTQNNLIDAENEKLELVKADPELNYQFNEILDERKAILMECEKLPEEEAERICTQPENIRHAIGSMEFPLFGNLIGSGNLMEKKKAQDSPTRNPSRVGSQGVNR